MYGPCVSCRHLVSLLSLMVIVSLVLMRSTAEGCSCLSAHPQQHYCTADYVIVARVRNVTARVIDQHNIHYKIKLNKVFKANALAAEALQSKSLFTPNSDAACGVTLEKGRTYLMAGRVISGRLRLVVCDFHGEWKALTVKQKKGFKLLYGKGCACQVRACPWWNRRQCDPSIGGGGMWCAWDTLHEGATDCQALESVCMAQPSATGHCGWNRSLRFRQCLKRRQELKERRRLIEP